MHYETLHGLLISPYKKRKPIISKATRCKIIQLLTIVTQQAMISEFAFIQAIYMFDKVMESIAMMNEPQHFMEHLIKKEFKIAVVCLYMSAKFEDPKYPFFSCFR